LPSIGSASSWWGDYDTLAYLVSQRTKEIGLRLAIGASPSNVVWLVVRVDPTDALKTE
jgi:ABC-type antimicrobial peptide transport system permease subunit